MCACCDAVYCITAIYPTQYASRYTLNAVLSQVTGLKKPVLICENMAGTKDKFRAVDPAGVCENFNEYGHSPVELAAALAGRRCKTDTFITEFVRYRRRR